MKISVVVPFCNKERFIRRCIEALLAQEPCGNEYEIVFVDNGSTDASAGIVQEYPRIKLLREERAGAYRARNRGAREATGEIVAFTDADCIVAKDWISEIGAGMDRMASDVALGAFSFVENADAAVNLLADYENMKYSYVLRAGARQQYVAAAGNMAVRAAFFKRVGAFSESSQWEGIGDIEFIQRCARAIPPGKIVFWDRMKVRHAEIDRFSAWLNKLAAYGSAVRALQRRSDFLPLSLGQRWAIFAQCRRAHRYGVARSLRLIFLLAVGFLSYNTGMFAKTAMTRQGNAA